MFGAIFLLYRKVLQTSLYNKNASQGFFVISNLFQEIGGKTV